jgi:hypothetical protein
LKKYPNIFFFLEEYYTLLAQFLRKIDATNIKQINIQITCNEKDYISPQAKKVSLIHVNNNFL